MTAVEVEILGPLVLRIDGRPVPLTAGKQRALVAILALRAGRPVSREELIDALWREAPPDSVDSGLNVLLSRVRRALGNRADLLERRPGGYVLKLAPDALDAARFETLHEQGRRALAAGDVEAARRRLREALALWRGRALDDLSHLDFAQPEARRLEELRAVALEDRIEADLAAGEAESLVPELEALVEQEPLRERLQAQLMRALYGSGRQAEALARYRAVHRLLAEEVGIEPGPELRRVHEAMLRQDPELAPPRRPPARRPRRRRRPLAALLPLAAGVAALALLLAWDTAPRRRPSPPSAQVRLPPNAVAALHPRTGARRLVRRVGPAPAAVATGETGVWVLDRPGRRIVRLDPESGRVTAATAIAGDATDVLPAGSAVWLSTSRPRGVVRVDARRVRVTDRIPSKAGGSGAAALAKGDGAIWSVRRGGDLERLSLSALRATARVPMTATGDGLAVGGGAAWVSTASPLGIARVPVRGGAIGRLPLEHAPVGLVYAGGAVWAAVPAENRVLRVDPVTASVTRSAAIRTPSHLAASEALLWVAGSASGTLARIDLRTGRVVRSLRTAAAVRALAVGPGGLWVVTGPALSER